MGRDRRQRPGEARTITIEPDERLRLGVDGADAQEEGDVGGEGAIAERVSIGEGAGDANMRRPRSRSGYQESSTKVRSLST